MAEQVTSLTPEETRMIALAWLESLPRQVDVNRTMEAFQTLSRAAVWYKGPGRSWLIFTPMGEQYVANFHALNLDGRRALNDIAAIKQTIKEVMVEHQLRRLHVAIPAPLTKVRKAAKDIGFKHEGVLRAFTMFNGKPTDVYISSILFSEYDTEPPVKRRRRRSRRKHGSQDRGTQEAQA